MNIDKFKEHISKTNFDNLKEENKKFIEKIYDEYKFSYQELKQLIDFAIDFNMWNEKELYEVFEKEYNSKKEAFNHIRTIWNGLKEKANSYDNFDEKAYEKPRRFSFTEIKKDKIGLGSCPVASENTRCCNLLTLDAVQSCGFDCSYCSIQSFYNQDKIGFDVNFKENLKNLELDPNYTYHIGTGQSSDSLMWGNKDGILEALFDFARKWPNIILEFKTKSNNIKYFLENEVPANIICTWSLNTQTIIDNEEHLTASLNQRIEAAQKLAQKGVIVGFHFHPIVHYENYLEEYKEIFDRLIDEFNPENVALVSFGTLTFIKPVINKIKSRDFKSKILQMPFEEINKKQSYPYEIKKEMFKFAYESFKPWHNKVYFYLCMEDQRLWKECFGYEYSSNNQMEDMMKMSYFNKINQK